MNILAVNAGSSSFKFKLFNAAAETVLAQGAVERIGGNASAFQYRSGETRAEGALKAPDHLPAVRHAIDFLKTARAPRLDGVGFKTVFAKGFTRSTLIDEHVIAGLEAYIPVMPLHNPAYLACIRTFQSLAPDVPLAAVFETAFHETIPPHARELGLPRAWTEKHGLRRYGFHGASHRWVSERAPLIMKEHGLKIGREPLRLISCHLGGSSSLCAVLGGKSIDVTMSFSAQSGVLQGSRCGDLDPFIPIYLMSVHGMSVEEISRELMTNAGLAGVSGIPGGDLRDLLDAAEKEDDNAALALDAFHYGVQKAVGAYIAALGGVDILAFTGGIGERSAVTRQAVCARMEPLGLILDEERNRSIQGEGLISADDSPAAIFTISANEEIIVARETARLIKEKGDR